MHMHAHMMLAHMHKPMHASTQTSICLHTLTHALSHTSEQQPVLHGDGAQLPHQTAVKVLKAVTLVHDHVLEAHLHHM